MSVAPASRGSFGRVVRFLVVGSVATVADLVVYLLLVKIGAVPAFAKAASYASGTLLGFLGNKFWTFGSMRRSVAEPITYAMLYALTLVVNVAINGLVLHVLGRALSPPWERGVAFLVATVVTTVLNFLGLRFLTFSAGSNNGVPILQKSTNASR